MEFPQKNLLVLASAGSGKTFRLSDRVIALLAAGAEPEQIVALTFTRKAAGEFSETILSKLAAAADDPAEARLLEQRLGLRDVDFTALLKKTVSRLPRLSLGTMDQFFSRILRAFQYELGISGGKFELLEGEDAETLRDDLIADLLEGGSDQADEDFIRIFRRATAGREGTRVIAEVRKFINGWHSHFLSPGPLAWGPAALAGAEVNEWETGRDAFLSTARKHWPETILTDKRQEKAFADLLAALEGHGVASGSLEPLKKLLADLVDAVASGADPLEVSHYKPFKISGNTAIALRGLLTLAARCELAAALERTRGIRSLIAGYDAIVERELRTRGKLGFDDVKRLMGGWMRDEDARLRREAVDFRLDSRHSHWLLDEFQDTSRADWEALLPLVDEGMTGPDSTVFVVGDRKQAIYSFRGGEVGLFNEITAKYGSGLLSETMAESWRSCPEILAPVNAICGDLATITHLFGPASSADWIWDTHTSAGPLLSPEKAGHSRFELIAPEEKPAAVIDLLHHLGVGTRLLSCGILVNTNVEVSSWAEELRSAGFSVVADGKRKPAEDHPIGVMAAALLRWLANPADQFAKTTVLMSPLGPEVEARFGPSWQNAWEKIGALISRSGHSGTLRDLFAPLRTNWTPFENSRADELITALREMDRKAITTTRGISARLARLTISQPPGAAAIQIMTVHKSKGLGFDVVILPEISATKIPDLTHLATLSADGWISSAPTRWARALVPELAAAEETWSRQQKYDAFCKLYVSLTRAKRGLYVFLDPPKPKDHDFNKPSFANWIMRSLGLDAPHAPAYETGDFSWSLKVPEIDRKPAPGTPALGPALPKRDRSDPSSPTTRSPHPKTLASTLAARHGSDIHAAFEKISWLDEEPFRPVTPADQLVAGLLKIPGIAALFTKSNRSISLHREQPLEALANGKWLSGIIDRLHLHRAPDGTVTRIEIIDFKTDSISSPKDLREKYTSQMRAYRNALLTIHPAAEITSILLSTHSGELVELS